MEQWRSGKRRREEAIDADTGSPVGIAITDPRRAECSAGPSSLARLIQVKTEAAEEAEEADKLSSQQHQYIEPSSSKAWSRILHLMTARLFCASLQPAAYMKSRRW